MFNQRIDTEQTLVIQAAEEGAVNEIHTMDDSLISFSEPAEIVLFKKTEGTFQLLHKLAIPSNLVKV